MVDNSNNVNPQDVEQNAPSSHNSHIDLSQSEDGLLGGDDGAQPSSPPSEHL